MGLILRRLERQGLASITTVLTTDRGVDDAIEAYVRSNHDCTVFRGPTEDVGLRFLLAAEELGVDRIIRITGDNPFVPAELIAASIESSWLDFDYSSRKIGVGFPEGTDFELFTLKSFKLLQSLGANRPDFREHVTPGYYLEPTSTHFRLKPISREADRLSKLSLTIDTRDDLARMRRLAQSARENLDSISWHELASIAVENLTD